MNSDQRISASEIESQYFDRVVSGSGDFDPFKPRGWKTLARRFTEMIRLESPVRVLDVGCGTGQSRQIYAAHASRYTGLDLSAEALRVARGRFPESEFIHGNACRLPFAERIFDVVAFSSVLHHIEDFAAALIEARRVLTPGGQVFAFDPNLLHPGMALLRHPKSPLYLAEGVSPNERPLLPSELRIAFTKAGFENIRQRCQSDIPYRSVAPKLVNAFLSVHNICDWALEHSFLGRCFGTFTITCATKAR